MSGGFPYKQQCSAACSVMLCAVWRLVLASGYCDEDGTDMAAQPQAASASQGAQARAWWTAVNGLCDHCRPGLVLLAS